MVKCFAPGCRNRQANPKEKIYLFKPSTEESIIKWANEIPRSDRPFGKNDYLCAKHFDQKDIIRAEIIDNVLYQRTHPTLVKNAIPKYFESPSKVVNVNTSKQHTEVIKTIIKKPTRVCVVCNCSDVIENGRTICYYLFPINPELRKEWIRAANLNNSDLSQFSYLCSKHFEENCFESVSLGTLKEDAVPSRFGFTTKSSSSISATTSSSDSDIPFCIVKSCQQKGNMRGITYHKIPTNNYENWLKVLKNYTKVDPIPLNSRVCSMHFKAKDFLIQGNKIKLNNGALPKLHINEYLLKNPNPLSINENEESTIDFHDECGVKKLRQEVLLTSVITPAADIVKSDFALIDINSIINKKIDNELKNTITQNRNKSTQNLTIIKAMHNYCNADADIDKNVSNKIDATPVVKKIVNAQKNNVPQLKTSKITNRNTILDENDDGDKSKRSLIKKLRAYKKAYKKHKSINRKQSDNILILENKLEENMKKNKKLEQRIVILEDLIQNMLRKREEYFNDMDKLELEN